MATSADNQGPIVVPQGRSAAGASHPNQELDQSNLRYDHNPVPWWLSLIWASFLTGGTIYLFVNLGQ